MPRHVPGRLDLIAAVAVGLRDRADPADVGDDAGEQRFKPSRSVPTGRHRARAARRRNFGASASLARASAATPGRPSPPSRIGARNHSIASTSPPCRNWPPPGRRPRSSEISRRAQSGSPARPRRSDGHERRPPPAGPPPRRSRADRASSGSACPPGQLANGGVRSRLSSTTRRGRPPSRRPATARSVADHRPEPSRRRPESRR